MIFMLPHATLSPDPSPSCYYTIAVRISSPSSPHVYASCHLCAQCESMERGVGWVRSAQPRGFTGGSGKLAEPEFWRLSGPSSVHLRFSIHLNLTG